MDRNKDTAIEAVLEQLIDHGPGEMASVFARVFEVAMQVERERFLAASHYERTEGRRGYANGYKPKRLDTPAGTVSVQVPKTAGHADEPFYPQSLERGQRSVRAVMLAVAEMYIKGVSTRDVEAVMRELGIESLSSSQVSRAARLLDEELEAWRNRPLGEIKYLIVDARYEKMRHGGIVRDVAVLSAIGIGPDERRRVLGISVALSEAEVHWRSFLDSLVTRGMRGVEFIVSDDHAGLRAARRAVLGAATWQRCQFHLAQNAIHHAPNTEIRKRIGGDLRAVWNACTLAKAETALAELVAGYRGGAPKLADWLEQNVPQGLAVLTLPEHHRRRLRTSNPIERCIQQELKRRTVKVRIFPSDEALLRLATAIVVEIDEKWASDNKAYHQMGIPEWGGWLNQLFGWRAAFILVGLPGLMIALAVRVGVSEPRRGQLDAAPLTALPPSSATLRILMKNRSYVLILGGLILSNLTGYAVFGWFPAFLMRVHHLGTGEVGLLMGAPTAGGLLIGSIGAGYFSDRLGPADVRWYMRITATGCFLLGPLLVLALVMPTVAGAIAVFSLYSVAGGFVFPPIYVAVHGLTRSDMRAMGTFLVVVVTNIGGVGFGPFVVGVMNDLLAPHFGVGAVRYSLMIAAMAAPLGGIVYLLANRCIRQEFERGEERGRS